METTIMGSCWVKGLGNIEAAAESCYKQPGSYSNTTKKHSLSGGCNPVAPEKGALGQFSVVRKAIQTSTPKDEERQLVTGRLTKRTAKTPELQANIAAEGL